MHSSEQLQQTDRMAYSDVHASGQGTRKETMFCSIVLTFSCYVEVGGMREQLFFPRNEVAHLNACRSISKERLDVSTPRNSKETL